MLRSCLSEKLFLELHFPGSCVSVTAPYVEMNGLSLINRVFPHMYIMDVTLNYKHISGAKCFHDVMFAGTTKLLVYSSISILPNVEEEGEL